MASDRSLATLLRALQNHSGAQDAGRLLDSAASLLTFLSNPLNISLLVSQTLTAPAIWNGHDELATAARLLGLFSGACTYVRQGKTEPSRGQSGGDISLQDWITAVVKGADDKSPRWRHTIVLSGLLIGLGKAEEHGLPRRLEHKLRLGLITATNLAIQEEGPQSPPEALHSVCVVVAHVFDLFTHYEKGQLDHSRLLPRLTDAMYFSPSGLNWAYFLGAMDQDIVQGADNKFEWSPRSSTFYQTQRLSSSPVVQALGVLSRMASFSISATPDIALVLDAVKALGAFSRSISVQWQQNKLSEVDVSEQADFLSEATLGHTRPVMWQLLKSALFSVVILHSAVISRLLSDSRIPASQTPMIATSTLHSLRHLYFITTCLGLSSFSQHTFVYLTTIDLLSQYPSDALAFLRAIAPSEARSTALRPVPAHPLSRTQDLFFLNTCEHFPLLLAPASSQSLILPVASTYTAAPAPPDPRLLDLFEAAHSATLAVLAAPQNHALATATVPHYFTALLSSFPASLSPRQLRLATRTLVRVVAAPPAADPLLAAGILEIVLMRAEAAGEAPLPTPVHRMQAPPGIAVAAADNGAGAETGAPLVSEKSALVLALVDSLPALSLQLLDEWLPVVAEAVGGRLVVDPVQQRVCAARFWDVLTAGEMDVPRAQACVAWWSTRGGRELVFGGRGDRGRTDQAVYMSGALGEVAKM